MEWVPTFGGKMILYLTLTRGFAIISKGNVSTRPHGSIPTSSCGQTAPAQVNHKQEHRHLLNE